MFGIRVLYDMGDPGTGGGAAVTVLPSLVPDSGDYYDQLMKKTPQGNANAEALRLAAEQRGRANREAQMNRNQTTNQGGQNNNVDMNGNRNGGGPRGGRVNNNGDGKGDAADLAKDAGSPDEGGGGILGWLGRGGNKIVKGVVSIGSPLEGIPLIGNPLNVLSPGGNLIEGVGEITGHATVDLIEGRPIDAVTGVIEGVGNSVFGGIAGMAGQTVSILNAPFTSAGAVAVGGGPELGAQILWMGANGFAFSMSEQHVPAGTQGMTPFQIYEETVAGGKAELKIGPINTGLTNQQASNLSIITFKLLENDPEPESGGDDDGPDGPGDTRGGDGEGSRGGQGGNNNQQPGTCFIAGTKITMADGTEKNIEDVIVGDIVKTETGSNPVVRLDPTTLGDRSLYSFNDDDNYFVTSEHPFKTRTGWKSLKPEKTLERDGIDLYNELIGHVAYDKTLHVGDEIKLTSGEYVKVENVMSRGGDYDTPLYNFHVENDPSYFADGYLVHNKSRPRPGGNRGSSGTGSVDGTTPSSTRTNTTSPTPGTNTRGTTRGSSSTGSAPSSARTNTTSPTPGTSTRGTTTGGGARPSSNSGARSTSRPSSNTRSAPSRDVSMGQSNSRSTPSMSRSTRSANGNQPANNYGGRSAGVDAGGYNSTRVTGQRGGSGPLGGQPGNARTRNSGMALGGKTSKLRDMRR